MHNFLLDSIYISVIQFLFITFLSFAISHVVSFGQSLPKTFLRTIGIKYHLSLINCDYYFCMVRYQHHELRFLINNKILQLKGHSKYISYAFVLPYFDCSRFKHKLLLLKNFFAYLNYGTNMPYLSVHSI